MSIWDREPAVNPGDIVYVEPRHLSMTRPRNRVWDLPGQLGDPVYHESGKWSTTDHDELRTACGLMAYRYPPDPRREPMVLVRLDVARRFARPCERCH